MEVVTDLAGWPRPAGGTVVTIGVYDGVHAGHRAVIGLVQARAGNLGVPSVVVTFDPHPAVVVRPESAPRLLTDLAQRLEILESIGVDLTVVITFDEARSREEPEDFVREILVDGLGARALVVGEDFHFGRGRRGNVALLESIGQTASFEVVRVGPVANPLPSHAPAEAISSTYIRGLVAEGLVSRVENLLGRPYEVRGVVVRGDQRGRELGFPTANVEVPPTIALPGPGIFAGWYERPDGSVYPTAISVGLRPTFHPEAGPVVLEAFLVDFTGDLYGETAKVRFTQRLRDEEKYHSAEDLVAQMRRDVAATRAVLSG